MNTGSHHMNLYRALPVYVTEQGLVDGQRFDCFAPLPLDPEHVQLIFNNQTTVDNTTDGKVVWQLPPDVGLELTVGEMLILQTHYVNATTQVTPLHGKVLVNFHHTERTAATQTMCAMFANNRSIRMPPRENYEATTTCAVPMEVHVVGLGGHFHSRGTDFTIRKWDGTSLVPGTG